MSKAIAKFSKCSRNDLPHIYKLSSRLFCSNSLISKTLARAIDTKGVGAVAGTQNLEKVCTGTYVRTYTLNAPGSENVLGMDDGRW